jgi:glycosyltransferase involved in cell wall biosynthesis
MRALHLSGDAQVGGVESFLITLARNSAIDSAWSHVFAFTADGPAVATIRNFGGEVHYLGRASFRQPSVLHQARRRLNAVCSDCRYDVAVFHQYPYLISAFADVLLRHKVKLVRFFHNEIDQTYWLERLTQLIYGSCLKLALYDSCFLLQAIPNAKGSVVYCPVDREIELPQHQRDEIRARHSTSADEPVVVQLSRMAERKGHMRLLRALATLKSMKWTCWIIGGPQTHEEHAYFSRVTALASEVGIADRVRFLGTRSDVPELLGASDIFCHPNVYPPEPFGIAFVEALQAGLPVVTSAMGGAIEIISEQCGVLLPPCDDAALAEALGRLLESRQLRQQMGAAARARGRDFTPAIQIPCLNAALNGAL